MNDIQLLQAGLFAEKAVAECSLYLDCRRRHKMLQHLSLMSVLAFQTNY